MSTPKHLETSSATHLSFMIVCVDASNIKSMLVCEIRRETKRGKTISPVQPDFATEVICCYFSFTTVSFKDTLHWEFLLELLLAGVFVWTLNEIITRHLHKGLSLINFISMQTVQHCHARIIRIFFFSRYRWWWLAKHSC